jgi:A/G-specific adenine glycosylase
MPLRPFADRLLDWYDEHGRKDLPWQQPRTPYRVWISEIMLQQTQVATVIPYFERWMASFPDIGTLAAASQDEVLGHWSGLGYYARARNIHKAAGICMERHGGSLPEGAEALAALPGIGRSTANAIVSQSSGRPAAVLDGNVRRVLARHTATEGWTGSAPVQKTLWREAEARLPVGRGADYTQAVMDLGALVCTRAGPDCANCPVSDDCRALGAGLVGHLPSPKPKSRIGARTLYLLIVQDADGRVLLEKRPGAGIWGGLWCFPSGATADEAAEAQGIGVESARVADALEHRLSHLRLTLHPVLAAPTGASQVKCAADHAWFDRAQQLKLGLPKPVADLLTRLDHGELT